MHYQKRIIFVKHFIRNEC